jgi:glycogen debranching enzyme
MPIILGTRLPTDIQEQLATQIGTFLCAYGLATEHPDSPEFHQHDHAYWRSSVWPPPSLIAVTSLAAIGKKDLAKRIATNTGRGMATCHFRENHDPQTGGERSDLAFTWTASVFLTLLDHLT